MKKLNEHAYVLAFVSVVLIALLTVVCVKCSARVNTYKSIRKVEKLENGWLYEMNVKYAYNLESLLYEDVTSDVHYAEDVARSVLPGISINADEFQFNVSKGSLAAVICNPKKGYKSVSLCRHMVPDEGNADEVPVKTSKALMLSPFFASEAMNEKGVSVVSYSIESHAANMAVRLIADRAACTKDALALLARYGFMKEGVDLFIADSNGEKACVKDGVVTDDTDLDDNIVQFDNVNGIMNIKAFDDCSLCFDFSRNVRWQEYSADGQVKGEETLF